MEYEAVIGLEVHAQLLTESKIFCGCSTKFGAPPNTHVCPVCLGMPGVLPVLNQKVVEFTIRAGLATNCAIQPKSVWARKNYFYPDLSKNYQISQYELPICLDGWLDIEVEGENRRIGITRIHMEEDAGKLVHDPSQPVSYVDYNRTGVPLMEIVSEPDLRSPEEAGAYLRTLRDVLIYLEICDGNMEEGSFRCDANISLRPVGQAEFGIRAELKNMNSFRGVTKALEYEIRRQRAILDEGGKVVQETRLWDADQGKSFGMRGKEEAHDYRYLPDPDLPPLVVDEAWVERVRSELPELPGAKRARFMEAYGLNDYDAGVLTAGRPLADYYEAVVAAGAPPKAAANWMMTDLLGALKAEGREIGQAAVKPQGLAELIALIDSGAISNKMAKEVFAEMMATGKGAAKVVEEKGLTQVSDEGELEGLLKEIFAANPEEVEAFKGGKKKLMGFFVGQVMQKTKGQANPKLVNQLVNKLLGE
ncbi:MAG: Asp-tRNA(Asn)/Glu-tRNA(Gln) amidotransferase subunit GatB [Desulfarculaceae bacterium]|nr:Asp-tRNA(Asn)/Glu-tRNA(Gln) amidotransferase subunit GatB [Desulfarculaceae bacterium]MCF8072518.1 Asp-tRNA(Asn)/Glu-tRNA(Gln) amidotransferase subunit GatB [Desulfarculaceae bacterium]MCF8103659.1 Asp-tRNA(Asn)/Glu-tRNA(Gln) amidotransferase subunit GatB [Desulfarculaceae bacterium]MCF8117059.1 Asp-tRNA(Asn)/Glu-tRNA(Gln) amidotransferase subunit GatB [Desulfarculaceae bacterium]